MEKNKRTSQGYLYIEKILIIQRKSKEIVQFPISFGHLAVFGYELLQELAFPLGIHRLFIIHKVTSIFIEFQLLLYFTAQVHRPFDVNDGLLLIQQLIDPLYLRDSFNILPGEFNPQPLPGRKSGLGKQEPEVTSEAAPGLRLWALRCSLLNRKSLKIGSLLIRK